MWTPEANNKVVQGYGTGGATEGTQVGLKHGYTAGIYSVCTQRLCTPYVYIGWRGEGGSEVYTVSISLSYNPPSV